jgi:uncharacterized membrane protein
MSKPKVWSIGSEAARDTGRTEAFSDAVIAIMLTLLTAQLLHFDVNRARAVGLVSALSENWHNYAAFLLTFLVVGQMWITHHNLWRYIERVDQGILIINLVLLGIISVVPFAAQLLAESLAGLPLHEQRIAAAGYSAVMLGQALAFNAMLWWSRWRKLCHPQVDSALHSAIARRYLLGPSIYAAALVLSFINPAIGLACYFGVVLLYMIPGPGDLPTGRESTASMPD